MKFSLEQTGSNQIYSYDDNQIIISPEKQCYSLQLGTSLIVTPDSIITNTKIADIANLSDENINYLQTLQPEVAIFTTGSSTTPHHPSSNTALKLAKKLNGIESMKLGAACRTYNLLVLEGRRVILVISLT